jgi:hypothetical protein
VDQFISSLPASAAAEIFAYRDECKKRMQEADPTALRPPGSIRNSDEARASLGNFWRTADPEHRRLASRLVREIRRNPIGKFWISGGTTCIDMSLYDARDIADTARNFPRLLAHFDRYDEGFANYYRQIGMLGETLAADPPWQRPVESFCLRP